MSKEWQITGKSSRQSTRWKERKRWSSGRYGENTVQCKNDEKWNADLKMVPFVSATRFKMIASTRQTAIYAKKCARKSTAAMMDGNADDRLPIEGCSWMKTHARWTYSKKESEQKEHIGEMTKNNREFYEIYAGGNGSWKHCVSYENWSKKWHLICPLVDGSVYLTHTHTHTHTKARIDDSKWYSNRKKNGFQSSVFHSARDE